MLLAVLRHVEGDQGLLVAEEELGERLGELRLSDAGGAGEDERATRTLRVLEPGARAADRLREHLDRLLLADDPLVQLGLHRQQPRGLVGRHASDGHTGRHRQHLGDQVLVDHGGHVEVARLPGLLLVGALLGEATLDVAKRCGLLEVLRVDRRLLVATHVRDLVVEVTQLRRRRHPADAQARARLVDQVDRLVRQEAVGDVAVRHGRGGHDRFIRDGHAVERLVAVAQAFENLDGVRQLRLRHLDGLEAALERGVLLDVLAVLVERGGADGLQLASRQHGLEDRRGVDGALGGTGTHQGVDLVDEQDDVAAGADLLEHLLEALLEVTAVAGAGHQRAQVQRVEVLVLERLGHVAAHDRLGQALDHGRLAHAGLADQHGVVLGAARQHLHHALHDELAAHDGVELALARGLREVAAELVEHGRARGRALLGPTAGGDRLLALIAGQELDHLLTHATQVRPQLAQHLRCDALALADEAQQDVLGADVVVAQLQRLAQRQLEHLLGARGERDVPGRGVRALADDLLDLLADAVEGDVHGLEGLRRHALALADQAEQDVLRADVVVVEHARLFLREHHHSTGPIGEPFEHVSLP